MKKQLSLKDQETLLEKLRSIYDFTKIEFIYCAITNPNSFESPAPTSQLQVFEMAIPGGSPSYVKGKLHECFDVLDSEIKKYLESSDGFETIYDVLNTCTELCKKAKSENDSDNRFTFDEKIKFWVDPKDEWHRVMYQYLSFSKNVAIDFKEHFDIRKSFYSELFEKFSAALDWHRYKPDISEKPYTWDSSKAELEISELVYLICEKAELIKYNKALRGSFPKFRREFFGLFGLSDERYNQNKSDILKRKKDDHFIDELARLMPNTAPEIETKH
ncbi:MAG: hypothetical protein HOP10_02990 [Chitinophagaceae bacterium]|nr:hypothetical protein [Chitinophagaceae bacterium]